MTSFVTRQRLSYQTPPRPAPSRWLSVFWGAEWWDVCAFVIKQKTTKNQWNSKTNILGTDLEWRLWTPEPPQRHHGWRTLTLLLLRGTPRPPPAPGKMKKKKKREWRAGAPDQNPFSDFKKAKDKRPFWVEFYPTRPELVSQSRSQGPSCFPEWKCISGEFCKYSIDCLFAFCFLLL